MQQRYAAQAVTVDGYGDPEIVMQEIAPDGWPFGAPVANVPLDGDFIQAADLDHALTGAGYERVSDWEPAPFGSIAIVAPLA